VFDYPSQTLLLSEQQIGGKDSSVDDGNGFTEVAGQGKWNMPDRHLDTTNVLFMDGHVKSMKATKILSDGLMYGGNGLTSCP
jgi:prepilin-type processing-associated H-X9-DG protein